MRFFAVEGPPIRILAEGIKGGPGVSWDEEKCLSEEQLLETEEGRAALEAWRRGDDSVYEVSELADLFLSEAEDELIRAGSEAKPDLHARLRTVRSSEESEQILNELRQAGAEALGTER